MELLSASVQPGHEPGAYVDFLQSFIRRSYNFVLFHELDGSRQAQVVLRHDIDFDTKAALEMAEIESKLGVHSTYFFLLSSKAYNLMNPMDAANVKAIKAMGHEISLHFDPTIHEDMEIGLQHEVAIFEACFQCKVRIISFHRPQKDLIQKHDRPFGNVEHTYQSKYFRNVKYMSDSTGVWRFGHPCGTPEFMEGRSVQVLIHPIWWMFRGMNNVSKLDAYFSAQVKDLRKEVARNCIPYRNKLAAIEAKSDRLIRVQSHDMVPTKEFAATKYDRSPDHHRSAAGG